MGERVHYKFSAQVDENTVVDTVGFEVEDGDELSALTALCEYAREAGDPLLEDSSSDLQNVQCASAGAVESADEALLEGLCPSDGTTCSPFFIIYGIGMGPATTR